MFTSRTEALSREGVTESPRASESIREHPPGPVPTPPALLLLLLLIKIIAGCDPGAATEAAVPPRLSPGAVPKATGLAAAGEGTQLISGAGRSPGTGPPPFSGAEIKGAWILLDLVPATCSKCLESLPCLSWDKRHLEPLAYGLTCTVVSHQPLFTGKP